MFENGVSCKATSCTAVVKAAGEAVIAVVDLDVVQVTEWAAEVAGAVRQAVGAEGLAAGMHAARLEVQALRTKRKRALALQAVVDPEAAAQRRIKRNAKKAEERKRKRRLDRVLREAGLGSQASKKRRAARQSG